MNSLPIFLIIRDRPCLVVGGGDVAARKVALLQRAGGRVTVVAPALGAALAAQAASGKITHRAAGFGRADLDDCVVVIAATNNADLNKQVADLAQARRLPVNVVDQPALCSFIMPSIVDRSPVIVAVSSGGASPVLARLLRARLETMIPAAYGRLATLVAGFRQRAKARFRSTRERRAFWEHILQGPVAEMLFAGQDRAARSALEAALNNTEPKSPMGEVYLVGAGPGDPDLLTFRALRLMQQADVVVYDRLVAKPLLDLVRREAERIYVGKEPDKHTVPQKEINQLLARLAKEGKRVLRLKGGDPFIFGRGGEEIDTLAEEGVPFQVVPGITAASGCAAYAGIPITHRDFAQSCVFVTGHLKDGTIDLNWKQLVQPQQTVVFYMGVKGLDVICRELIAHGMRSDMPAALVEQGTTPNQRVFVATLATLPAAVRAADVGPPSLIIVGEVVQLHDKLAWFEPVALARTAARDPDIED